MDHEDFDFESLENEIREQIHAESYILEARWQRWGYTTIYSALVSTGVGIYTIAQEVNPTTFAAGLVLTYLSARKTMRIAQEIEETPAI